LKLKKTEILSIAAILLLLFSLTIAIIPIAYAHDPPWEIDTWAYISVEPNPIGVNQPVFVTMWIDKVPPMATGPWGPRWQDFTVKITKPDGTSQTLGPYESDSVGGAWTQFTPSEIGTYQFDFTFPGQVIEDVNTTPYPGISYLIGTAYVNDTYLPSSASTTLTVQEEPIEIQYGAAPLPTEYWERPISSMNREWVSIAGNWLGLRSTAFGITGMYAHHTNYNPYTTAPETAHVIWTKPIAPGGQVGGELGPEDTELYYTGTAYEAKFGAIIINGILYYTEVTGAGNNPRTLKAVNMRTGEEIWSSQMRSPYHNLKVGMVYNFKTGDQYGGIPYIFTSNIDQLGFYTNIYEPPVWSMYNAMDGSWILDIANVSANVLTTGPNGELLSYNAGGGMLSLFNMSKCIQENGWDQLFRIYTPLEIWRPPYNVTIDWNLGYEWSVAMAGPGAINTVAEGVIQTGFDEGGAFGVPGGAQTGWRVDTGYDADTGALLWGPINRTLVPFTALVTRGCAGEGIYTEYNRNEFTYTAYSLTTGQKLWTTEPEDSPWGYYDYAKGIVMGYGRAYSFGFGGGVYAYDVDTGERLWKFDPGEAGLDTPYGIWPLGTWGDHYVLADGKLYVRGGHDYTPPVWKGGKIYCIDVETGEEIWSSLSFDIVGSPAIADGTLIWVNGYDNQIYAYDKGPTKTTVEANPGSVTEGRSIIITGMVTDVSPGTRSNLLLSRFPNGVPAVSDESQSGFMEYLYQQQQMPIDATGVEVTIDVIDANGNFRNIGTATSDASGFYSLEWMPNIYGKYTVIATFEGSEAYYASYAETAFVVDQAGPTPTPVPTHLPEDVMGTYTLGIGIAILAAVIIIGVLILWKVGKK